MSEGQSEDLNAGDEQADTRTVNGTEVLRKENQHGIEKDYVRVQIGETAVVEVRRRLRNPVTERNHDLTKLSDDGYLKPFLAYYHATQSDDVIDLSKMPILTFDDGRWEYREVGGQHVIQKREAESTHGEQVLE